MITWLNNALAQYHSLLQERTIVTTDNGGEWHTITTPFLAAFNDGIELYCRKLGDQIELTDGGVTLHNLSLQGVDMQASSKRKDWLRMVELNFGIQVVDDALTVTATTASFAQKKLNLISAIIEVNEFEILAKHGVACVFVDEVKALLEANNIIYTPHFYAVGNTGLQHLFDFQIAGKQTEVVIKTFGRLDQSRLSSFLFASDDIKDIRSHQTNKDTKMLVILKQDINEVRPDLLEAMRYKHVDFVGFADLNKSRTYLTAA